MELKDVADKVDTIDVLASGAIGGILSWMLGEKKRSPWEALAIIIGGAFAAEYLTDAVLYFSGWQLPDRAVGFMLGVLGMRALDVIISMLERFAADPRELINIVIQFFTSKIKRK
jgi:hypothetical protein